MNILITGGCGFIGSNLAVALRGDGHKVTCLDNLLRRGSEILLNRVREYGSTFIHGDIRQPEDLDRIAGDFDLMIEASAEPSVLVGSAGADARFMLNNNLSGSINCFEWARERRVPVLFLSTSRVYPYDRINACTFEEKETRYELVEGPPGCSVDGISIEFPLPGARSLYGATKLCSELILQEYAAQYDLPCIINRCGVVAGPWQLGKVDQGVFTYWLAAHYFNRPLRYIGFGGQGKQVRDVLHVEDLVDLIRMQIEQIEGCRGQIFNAGGGRLANLSLLETTALCRELTGNAPEIGSDPETRPADVIWYVTENVSAQERFGWSPRRDGRKILGDIFEWLKSHEDCMKAIL